ncbi:uncharacterized protein [Dendropsophus ebraccatus]|uniref:uncharacterized protein isoform X2 n=1 Tax=Dendropsophus ebraccatus TaxID=150705 RepID=UPI0038321801
MEAARVVVLLLLHTAAALKLIVPQSHKAWLGKDVQIPCSYTVDKPPVDRSLLEIIWYHQGKQVLRVDDRSETKINYRLTYGDRVWDGGGDLYVSSTLLSDGGLYTCAVRYGSQRKEGEVRLDIQAPPQVRITGNTVVMNEESVLHCSITGFYPVDIDIRWFRGTEMLRDVIVENPRKNQDGMYNVTSSVTITPSEEDREKNFSCRVQHESLQQPLQERFQLLYGAVPTIHILPHTFKKNVEEKLVCYVSGFYPESIAVNWLLNGTSVRKSEIRRINSSALEAVLSFTPTEENWGQELSCEVQHGTLLHPQHESLTVLGKDLKARYKGLVVLVAVLLSSLLGAGTIFLYVYRYRQKRRPKLRTIAQSMDGSFSLNVDHFYPKEISVTWEVFQPPSSKTPQTLESIDLMQENQDGTYNVTSTTESLRGKVSESEEYMVRAAVTHRKLKEPLYREWTNHNKDNTYLMSSPELGNIVTPNLLVDGQAELQCTISHFYPDDLTVNWIRKVMENEEIITATEKYKIILHKSQQQRDKTFTCTACLLLTPSLEDQGSEIICSVTHPSLAQPTQRSTGQLQVWVKPTSDRPIRLSINDSGDVTAMLSLLRFYPRDIMITWSDGRSLEKKPSQETVTDNPDGTFSTNTECKIPGTLLEEKDFKIKVTWKHETMEKAECREMFIGHPDFPWYPRIVDMTPLILQKGKKTTITCKISEFFPNKLSVTWYEKRGTSVIQCIDGRYNTSCTPERTGDNSYSCSSSLSFTALSQSDDVEYICRVSHPSLQSPIERSTGKATVRVIPQMEKPVKFTPSGPDRVKCSMMLSRFYPSDVQITWTNKEDNNKPITSTRKLIQTDGDQTFDAISECIITWRYFMSGVRVTWEHQSLTSPQHQDLRVTDFPWRPVIEDIEKPVFIVGTKANVQCNISHYFPNNLAVSWYLKRKEGDNLLLMENITPSAERQLNNTYSCTAILPVTPSIGEHDGAEIICRVQHPSLETYIEKSTGTIQVYASPRMQDPIQWRHKSMTEPEKTGLHIKDADLHWCPVIEDIEKPVFHVGTDVTLQCRISHYFPNNLAVSWYMKKGNLVQIVNNTPSAEIQPDNTYLCSAILPVTPSIGDHGGAEIICRVQHPSLETYIEKSTGTIQVYASPQMSGPIQWSLSQGEGVLCILSLQSFYPKLIAIQWSRSSYSSITSRETYTDNADGTCNVISECRVTEEEITDPNYRITVTWRHKAMAEPERRELCIRDTDFPWRPVIEDIEKPVFLVGTDVTLQSRISHYFPNNLAVSWYLKRKEVDNLVLMENITPSAERQPDNTYSCTAILPVTPSIRDHDGAEIICRVQHLSLETYIEKSTGTIQVYGLPWGPTVSEIFTTNLSLNEDAILQCDISEYFPYKPTVSWFVKEKGRDDYIPVNEQKYRYQLIPKEEQDSESGHHSKTSLHFRPTLGQHHGVWFMCRVQHPSLKIPIEKTAGPLYITLSPELRDGRILTSCEKDSVLCSVTLRKFFPRKITITWKIGEDPVMASKTILQVNEDEEEAFNAISECRIPWDNLTLPVQVTWEHKAMAEPQSLQLQCSELFRRPILHDLESSDLTEMTEAEIQCRISGYYPDDVTVSWYKKEKGAQGLDPLCGKNKYKTSVTDPQRQPDGTYSCTASLRFTPTMEDQESEIICRVQHLSLETPIQRSSRPLRVQMSPELRDGRILTSCEKDSVLCSVTLRKFFPKKITITWKNGENPVMPSETILQVNEEDEEAFDAISECRIPWDNLTFPVQVTWEHKAMAEPQSLQLQRTELFRRPILQDLESSILTEMTEAEIQCRISGYYPDAVTVSWYKKEKGAHGLDPLCGKNKYKTSVTESQRESDGTYSCTASLRFTPTMEDQGSEIICRVKHPSLESPLDRSSRPLRVQEFLRDPILQAIEQPVLVEMIDAKLQCGISGYYPDGVTVSWYKKEKGSRESVTLYGNKYKTSVTKSQRQPDGTYSCTASLLFTPMLRDQESEIICTVKHPGLKRPLEGSSGPLCVRHIPWRPFIEEIDASNLSVDSAEAQIQCRISGYYPDAVTVHWYRKEKGAPGSALLHDDNKYKTSVTEYQRQPDGTYSCTASLCFTPTLRDQGSEIICQVEHPSLETPIQRSSGPLEIKNLTGKSVAVDAVKGREEVLPASSDRKPDTSRNQDNKVNGPELEERQTSSTGGDTGTGRSSSVSGKSVAVDDVKGKEDELPARSDRKPDTSRNQDNEVNGPELEEPQTSSTGGDTGTGRSSSPMSKSEDGDDAVKEREDDCPDLAQVDGADLEQEITSSSSTDTGTGKSVVVDDVKGREDKTSAGCDLDSDAANDQENQVDGSEREERRTLCTGADAIINGLQEGEEGRPEETHHPTGTDV